MDMKDELNRAADREYPHLPESATIASQHLRIAERAAFAVGFAAGATVCRDATVTALGVTV